MKHSATDSRGKIHTRDTRSSGRIYSHAVVVHVAAREAEGDWKAREAYSFSSWSSRRDLAEKAANQYRGRRGFEVEIIEAVRS